MICAFHVYLLVGVLCLSTTSSAMTPIAKEDVNVEVMAEMHAEWIASPASPSVWCKKQGVRGVKAISFQESLPDRVQVIACGAIFGEGARTGGRKPKPIIWGAEGGDDFRINDNGDGDGIKTIIWEEEADDFRQPWGPGDIALNKNENTYTAGIQEGKPEKVLVARRSETWGEQNGDLILIWEEQSQGMLYTLRICGTYFICLTMYMFVNCISQTFLLSFILNHTRLCRSCRHN